MRRLLAGRYGITIIALVVVLVILVIVIVVQVTNRSYNFADDFNGPAGSPPDPAKWSYDIGGGGWGNGELQDYTNSRKNSFLDGQGNLVLRATRQNDTYSSARLTTAGHFSQRYGHWEMRAKINSQTGLWPAWWMLGNNFSTVGWPRCSEVDMVEDYGYSAVESSVHVGTTEANLKTRQGDIEHDNNWHVWSMDWTPRGIAFSVDGQRYFNLTWNRGHGDGPASPDVPMFMLLNLAVGGNVGAPPPDASFPVDFVVDYVHVW